jgi:hypothetical protein
MQPATSAATPGTEHASAPRVPRRAILALLGLAAAGLGSGAFWFVSQQSSARAPRPQPAPIDGQRAFRYLEQICALGPRIAGTEANTRQRQMAAEHFKQHGATVREQAFAGRDPRTGETVQYANLIASWLPEKRDRILLGAHYDTRPYPDREIDQSLQEKPFLGANDGASGVALLMELAHHMNDLKPSVGVDFVLFDAEERVYGPQANLDDYFLGSKHFAQAYRTARRRGRTNERYVAALILDMIADRDLEIPREGYSVQLQPRLVREVWDIARQLDAKAFTNRVGIHVSDDHLPLNDAGIPAIDLIDFDYPHWHRASDTPEQCSPASLEQVGKVVSAWIALPRRVSRN